MREEYKLDFESIIPENTALISLDRYGGKDGVIWADIDGDKKDEIVYAYTYVDGTCIGILKQHHGEYKIADLYKGHGVRLSYIKVCRKDKEGNIVVGWTIDGRVSLLSILRMEEGIMQNQLKDEKIIFNKIDVVTNNHNTDYYIVLWHNDKKNGYKVEVYEIEDGELKKTNKHNKEYYINVEQYYNIMINKHGKNSYLLYNLAMAQYVEGKQKEALESINESLKYKEEEDIPKKREIEKLKELIKSKN